LLKRLDSEFAVVYLVLPNAGRESFDKALAALLPLVDDQKNNRVDYRGGRFRRLKLAPVKDVEAFGARQEVGRVLAYDPAKRALLIEVGAARGERSAWKGADYLARQVTAREARWDMETDAAAVSQEHPVDQVVCVRVRGGADGPGDVRRMLCALLDGEAEARTVRGVGLPDSRQRGLVIAPVKDLEALAKKIDFARVVFVDAEHRVLILEVPAAKSASRKKAGAREE
jgi:hypothetical protein